MRFTQKPINMALSLILSASFISTTAFAGKKSEEKKQMKEYFLNVSPEIRNSIIANSHSFRPEVSTESISDIDVVQDLQNRCGSEFIYKKITEYKDSQNMGDFSPDKFDTYEWPKITCNYQPKEFSGQSTKFGCDISQSSGDQDLRKVKYVENINNPTTSEVFNISVATLTANLIGLYTNTYCPAQVTCKNCPSDNPWRNNRSNVPGSNREYRFKWTLVENKDFGYKVINPKETIASSKPQGILWDELKLSSGESIKDRSSKIEREAWMLYIQFIRHFDADAHNQKLLCLSASRDEKGNIKCDSSVAMTTDFGLSFMPLLDAYMWGNLPALEQVGDQCRGTLDRFKLLGLKVGSNPGEGVIIKPFISSEARDLLVSKMERITDNQWRQIFELSKVEEVSNSTTDQWVSAVKKKIKQMKSVRCAPYDSGRSVLFSN